MSVRIQLHSPTASYTNLDVISGSVFLYIQAPSTFSVITVKLEGESRTRLSGHVPGPYHDQRQRPTTELEVHKVSTVSTSSVICNTNELDSSCTRHRLSFHPLNFNKMLASPQASPYRLVNMNTLSRSRYPSRIAVRTMIPP